MTDEFEGSESLLSEESNMVNVTHEEPDKTFEVINPTSSSTVKPKKRKFSETLEIPIDLETDKLTKNNICNLYTELLAEKLKQFNDTTREILMHQIDSLVFKTKMKQLYSNIAPKVSSGRVQQNTSNSASNSVRNQSQIYREPDSVQVVDRISPCWSESSVELADGTTSVKIEAVDHT